MKNAACVAVALILLSLSLNARAAEMASATVSVESSFGSPTTFQYAITLDNTGTTTVGTLWYAWVPGQDFLKTLPTNITSPAGWQETITGSGNSSDGYAIQWKASSTAANLAAGGILTGFSFESTDTLTQITTGLSVSHPSTQVGTSFIYENGPLTDSGFELLVAAVPEPATLTILGASASALLLRRKSRRT